jgi:large repetitive protein
MRRVLLALSMLVTFASSGVQAADSINLQVYQPSAFAEDLPSLATTNIGFPYQLTAGVNAHYTANPLGFVGTDAFGRTSTEDTLTSRMVTDVCMSFAFSDFLDLGVVQSFVVNSTGKTAGDGFSGIGDLTGFVIGELRLSLKSVFLRRGLFRIGLQADATLPIPTGAEEKLATSGLGGGPRLLMDIHAGPVMIAINAGAHLRDEVSIGEYITVGHELTGGIGMSVRVVNGLAMLGEAFFKTQLDDMFSEDKTQLEWMAGVRYQPHNQFAMTVGGGSGTPLFMGYGTSQYRFFADMRWMMEQMEDDKDGDGIDDGMDQCPLFPEDIDAYRDLDGCPDPDNDGDGFLDEADQCPNQAEDRDLFEDDDGCPELDNDQDGIVDEDDNCPLEKEDKDLFEDGDGCPELDNDGDGILDADDTCPNKSETKNGFEDTDGCPDFAGVSVQAGKLVLSEKIIFELGRVDIPAKNFAGLRNMAKLIRQNPAWKKIKVNAHSDTSGTPSDLLMLTQKQANSVLQFLVTEGVEFRRLEARGFGGVRPIAPNKSRKGRAQNRRVEFILVR